MHPLLARLLLCLAALALPVPPARAAEICEGYGPQAPRDIASRLGLNRQVWSPAPPAAEMRLCNIHLHAQAEHKGPGFSVPAGDGPHGGWACNDTWRLSPAELAPTGRDSFEGVSPGNTVEVHWVFTSCPVGPGPGLGSCLSETCANPELRVEAQVFLLVNDAAAPDFSEFAYHGESVDGRPQPRALPEGTGAPVTFAGSTTGPSYSQAACSPLQVTWSVRPDCARLDIGSLHDWAQSGNVFEETHAHGVRALVTAPELLSPIP